MMKISSVPVPAVFAALLAWPAFGQTDPGAELKAALTRYSALSPIRARLSAQVWSKSGEGADAQSESGEASVIAELGPQGLRLTYASDLLSRLAAEEESRDNNAKARTATASSVGAIGHATAQEVLNGAPDLTRLLRRATFKSMQPETLNGQVARKLVFDLGPPPMGERERKYVSKTDGTLEVWVAPDGAPLAHKSRFNVSGRAFVVISFEARTEEDVSYSVVADRLVITRRESRSSGSGAGERGESRRVVNTTLLPN